MSGSGLVEQRLAELGLILPAPTQVPAGAVLPFAFIHVCGKRVLISGHGPVDDQGRVCAPYGKLGADLSVEQGYDAARRTGLSILADLKAAIGSLDRVGQWVRLFGMVNNAPDFTAMPAVINGCSDLILHLYGPEAGQHARSAIGVAGLPWNIPVEIEGELLLLD